MSARAQAARGKGRGPKARILRRPRPPHFQFEARDTEILRLFHLDPDRRHEQS